MHLATLLAMHAPDGLFSAPVNLAFAVVAASVATLAARRVSAGRDHRAVPMMGITGAFIFAAQMVNFPVASGTTGHLVGGTLAAVLLGPWAGTVVMTAVIVVQALVFQDGGVTALGPNVFNMAVIGTIGGYCVWRAVVTVLGSRPARITAAAFFASWQTIVLAAISVSIQVALSGAAPIGRVLPAMVLTHMVIGVGEGLITAAVVAFLLRTRPDLLHDQVTDTRPIGPPVLVAGLTVAVAVGGGLSLLPSLWDYPDGLESVGAQMGFLPSPDASPAPGRTGSFALLPDYTVGGLNGLTGTTLAGGIGTLLMFGLSFGVGRALVRPAFPVPSEKPA